MGNVMAAGPGVVPSPPMAPSPPTMPAPAPTPEGASSPAAVAPEAPKESGPGTFEELHKKCKEVFPVPFEGCKLLINKGLSNHFQISHTVTMSTLQPSGYKFGCTYVGTRQFGPMEAFPILIGDVSPSGDLNANIIHQLTKQIRCKAVSSIQGGRWVATQLTSEYRGNDFTAAATMGNPDLVNESGMCVLQYLQKVTNRLSMGAEMLYQYGPQVPGNQIAIYTLAGRYEGDQWQASANLTPAAGGVHACYYHKVNESTQIGCELEGSLRTQECTGTVGYQIDIPNAALTFRGQLDSNWCVGAVLEKRLPPLPFTLALSAFANHVKNTYRFGIGLIVG